MHVTSKSCVHDTPAADVRQTLRRGTRNGITELSQAVPPIFVWAAITLDIGSHSSSFLNFWAIISLERVKLYTSNLVCRLILTSSSMHDRYPRIGCIEGHVTCLNFGK